MTRFSFPDDHAPALEALPLFSQPVARNSDPETSWQAADRVADKAPTDRLKVLAALKEHGKGSDFDLEQWTGVIATSIGVRRGELVKAGLVVDSGERGVNGRGSKVILWRLS